MPEGLPEPEGGLSQRGNLRKLGEAGGGEQSAPEGAAREERGKKNVVGEQGD